jgi:hypothetical protein
MTTPTPTPDIVQILRAFDVHDDFDRLDEAATTIEELREAVRVLGEFAAAKLEGQKNHIRQAKPGTGVLKAWQQRCARARAAVDANPIARAACEGTKGTD